MQAAAVHKQSNEAKPGSPAKPFFAKSTENSLFSDRQNGQPFFSGVQTKLTIGEPGDKYEQEADATADQVVQQLSQPVPAVQSMCVECAKEELQEKEAEEPVLQQKSVSSGEAPSEEMIHRKCTECQKEEPLQKKGTEKMSSPLTGISLENRLYASKGRGSTLPENVRNEMGVAFGADFSHVKIHTDTESVQMNKALNAQAFTHNNDIYFNQNKYDTNSSSGKHLLAHELTHTIQQGASATGRESLQTKKAIQTYPQAGAPLPSTEKQATYYKYRNKVYDIMGEGSFEPGGDLGNYIASLWENGQEAPVNIQFGSLASGYIWVKPKSSFVNRTCVYLPVGLLMGVEVCKDTAPDAADYHAQPQVIPLEHPALNTQGKGSLVLIVGIGSGVIDGKLGWIAGKTKDQIEPLLDAPSATTDGAVFYPFIFGEEHQGREFQETNKSINSLSKGSLSFFVHGDLTIDHQQKINAFFGFINSFDFWYAHLKTDIQGTEEDNVPIERTPQGYLSAESNEIRLDKEWTDHHFSASGTLIASYANGNFSLYGEATYSDKRLEAEASVSVSLSDREKAKQLFLEHVPAKKTEQPSQEPYLDTGLPDPEQRLALVAWGQGKFKWVDEIRKLTGDAAFVVSPEGYIVTAGQVKMQQDFTLMDLLSKYWELFTLEKSLQFFVGPAPLKVRITGSLGAGYSIGPITFVELSASGVYSNHPDYAKELCISGTIDMPASLSAYISATIAASVFVGYKKFGITLIEGGGKLDGIASLNAFVRATPALGIRKENKSKTQYCLSGKLYVGGQMKFDLYGSIDIAVFEEIDSDGEKKKVSKGQNKKDAFASWTIGDFGLELGVDYTLGSGEKPEFTYSGKDFDEAAFLKAMWRGKGNKAKRSDPKLEGGFAEEGGEEVGAVQDQPFEPIDHSADTISPYTLQDSFAMEGKAHALFLTIQGTQAKPEVKLEMASDRRELVAQIEEEITMIKDLKLKGNFSEKEEKKIDQAIRDLENIKNREINRVMQTAKNLAEDPLTNQPTFEEGLERLGDQVAEYGDRYDKTDLGAAAAPITVPPDPCGAKVNPAGVEVILLLPPQKAIYLAQYQKLVAKGELYHSKNRATRDTEQLNKWNQNMRERMLLIVKCKGVALDLFDPALSKQQRDRNILRPFWTPRRILGTDQAGTQRRMTVDHVIEWQVRPLCGENWIDEPWNFELLEPSANSSSGPRLSGNIERERRRLAQQTKDPTWITDDIKFTKVETEADVSGTERYAEKAIEDGKHLKDYQRLTGREEDPQKLDECKNAGADPF